MNKPPEEGAEPTEPGKEHNGEFPSPNGGEPMDPAHGPGKDSNEPPGEGESNKPPEEGGSNKPPEEGNSTSGADDSLVIMAKDVTATYRIQ